MVHYRWLPRSGAGGNQRVQILGSFTLVFSDMWVRSKDIFVHLNVPGRAVFTQEALHALMMSGRTPLFPDPVIIVCNLQKERACTLHTIFWRDPQVVTGMWKGGGRYVVWAVKSHVVDVVKVVVRSMCSYDHYDRVRLMLALNFERGLDGTGKVAATPDPRLKYVPI